MIIIDPSKGGTDLGVQGNGIIEKDYNLLISKYIYDRLRELGANVSITRDEDIILTNEERVNKIINTYGNNKNVIVLSNILNSGNSEGTEIVYALRNNDKLAQMIASNLSDIGRNVNKYYQRRSTIDTSKDYYDIQKDTGDIETIIVNYGYVDNVNDANKLINNYREYAEAVVKAIANYKNIPYIKKDNSMNVYIVKKGDSLYSIAKKYSTTVERIKELNNLKSNLINIGQVLIINEVKPISSEVTYIVKKGDSLYSISKRYDILVSELKTYNNLLTNIISIDQILKIPLQNIYVVKKGDSLYSIAKKYNTTVEKLKNKNKLNSNLLSIGQQLIV